MSNPNSVSEARRVLEELETETLERIKSNEATTESPQINSAVGRLTYIDAYQQEQLSLRARRQLQAKLSSIRAALQRLNDGSHGVCVKCGQAILPERLEYMPETPFCTNCG